MSASELAAGKPFRERVALVTGGTSGIGARTAIEFSAAGAAVVLTGRRAERGEAVVASIREQGGVAHFVAGDMRDESDVERCVRAALERFGRLDYAFNNAGTNGTVDALADQTDESWDDVLSLNLTAVWRCMKHEIRAMLATGGGVIVNNSSILGLVGVGNGVAPYVASKHGVVGLTRAAALEYATQGIRVNAVCPGLIQSEMLPTDPAVQARLEGVIHASVPMRRIGYPEDVARAVLWLCSGDSAFATGVALAIDGGWTAR
jgi:NAD(P)-dependent dehydrogenase (short-subunit alcohol dehydrogenase family)